HNPFCNGFSCVCAPAGRRLLEFSTIVPISDVTDTDKWVTHPRFRSRYAESYQGILYVCQSDPAFRTHRPAAAAAARRGGVSAYGHPAVRGPSALDQG